MENIKFTLDLWNWYIKGIMTAKENWKEVLIAKDKVKTRWMRKGRILDMDDFVFCIRSLFDSFEKKLWWDYFDDIVVWISHPDMIVKRVSEQKRVVSEKITQEDVDHLSNLVYDTTGVQNYETVKIIPVQWVIDDDIKLKDPIWMEWKKLEIISDVFMFPKNFFNSLNEVFEKLELDINDIVPNILWACDVAMDFDAKDLWTLLVDIWANQTSYCIYEEWYPLSYWVVPIWGEEVTKDISIWLQVDIKESEKIKKEKWYVYTEDETIKEDDSIDTAFLSNVITARYEEIFENINNELVELWKDGRLAWWVVLVWWGSNLPNLEKLCKDQFKLSTSYWKDKIVWLWEVSSSLEYINCIGCQNWSSKYSDISWGSFASWLWFGWIKRIIKYIKDMF